MTGPGRSWPAGAGRAALVGPDVLSVGGGLMPDMSAPGHLPPGGSPSSHRAGVGRVRLVRPSHRDPDGPLVLDEAQRRVVNHRGGPLLVLAGPGTGKTATVVETVAARVADGLDPESVLVLTFSRRAAAELRDRLSTRLARTTTEPLARTFHGYAFGLLRRDAVAHGLPEPRLLTAADADLAIRELLAGRRADAQRAAAERAAAERGDPKRNDPQRGGAGPSARGDWPPGLRLASTTAGFAAELGDLLSRAAERGLGPDALAELAATTGRGDWAAAADFAAEYDQVSSLSGAVWMQPATLVRSAVALLRADPGLLAAERATRRLVVVDEFQDCDPAQVDLLELIAGGGELIAVGDPDQSIYAFRGSDRSVVDAFPTRFATPAGPAPVAALTVSRRAGPTLLAVSRQVATRLGGPTAHRALVPGPGLPDGAVQVAVHPSAAAERGWLAGRLRAAHLRDGVDWSAMAVLVRTGAQLAPVRRALRAAGIPATAASDPVPLAQRPAARDLLALARLGLDAAGGSPGRPDAELVLGLLAGPFGGLDTVAVRALRATLGPIPTDALPVSNPAGAAGSERRGPSSTAALVTAFADPGGPVAARVGELAPGARRLLGMIGAGGQVAADGPPDAGRLLWALWSASGRAAVWSAAALAGGSSAAVADRNLDAVVGLFEEVERYADEHPRAGATEFLLVEAGRALPGAVESRPAEGAVAVLTAHAAKGLQWPVVVVAGVQEGTWPDLRGRRGLLGQRELVRLLDGTVPAVPDAVRPAVERAEALAEERRLFYVACTRASHQLVLSAVEDRDDRPSRFLTELTAAGPAAGPVPPGRRPAGGAPEEVPVQQTLFAGREDLPAGDGTPAQVLPGRRGAPGSSADSLPDGGPDGGPGARPDGGSDGGPDAGPGRTGDRAGGQSAGDSDGGFTELRGADLDAQTLDPSALVARLRRAVCTPGAADTARGRAAARQLARLAAGGVPGADPDGWWGRAPLSDGGPRIAPGTELVLSPSRLGEIDTCPLRWFLTQAGGRRAATSAQLVGVLIHSLAEEVARGSTPVQQLAARFEQRSGELGLTEGWADRRERARVAGMVQALAAWFRAQADEGWGVDRVEAAIEHRVDHPDGPLLLRGRVDLVDRPASGGGLRVIDFKTGKTVRAAHEVVADPQLATYQAALAAESGSRTGGAALVFLSRTGGTGLPTVRGQAPPDATGHSWLGPLLDRAGTVVRAPAFPALVNEGCGRCPVRESCPAQPTGVQVTA